jgi:hypothetical protein
MFSSMARCFASALTTGVPCSSNANNHSSSSSSGTGSPRCWVRYY